MKIKHIIILTIVLIIGISIGRLTSSTKEQKEVEEVKKMWTCSMHPEINLPEFGDCPICGMDLIQSDVGTDNLSENAFKMTKNAMALANIETFEVGSINIEKQMNSINISGQIKTNENKTNVQIAPFAGRIEKMYIKSVSEFVKKGKLIASIYSPELIVVQNEFIEAVLIKEEQPELYESIKKKLELLEISKEQIHQIEHTKKVVKIFNLYSNVSGYVTDIFAEEGNYINEGATLFKVANLNSVWAEFDVYEQDIKSFFIGQEISIIPNAYPEMEITTKVDFIDPILNTDKRTVIIRTTLKNSDGKLKPGMFVNGFVYKTDKNNSNAKIIVPKTAVLWTGKRSVVYVKDKGDEPVFEMRNIKIAGETNEFYEISSGLKIGEIIVSNGTFTVDAAAQLSGKKSMMSNLTEEVEELEVDKSFLKQLEFIFEDYMKLRDALVEANNEKAIESARNFEKSLLKVQSNRLRDKKTYETWMKSENSLNKALEEISKTNDVEKNRLVFINLSKEMINIVKVFGFQEPVYIVHCPMADNNRGADWISFKNEVVNPYFGDKMLHCGKVKQVIEN